MIAVFLWLALATGPGSSLAEWDAGFTDRLVSVRTAAGERIFWCFTLLGNIPVMTSFSLLAVLLFLAWGRRRWAVLFAGSLASAEALSRLAKAAIDRPRPPESVALIGSPLSASLPSGHAFLTLVFLGLLVFVAFGWIGAGPPKGGQNPHRESRARRKSAGRRLLLLTTAVVGAAVVVVVGLSRIYLGVHWATDVFAGWCLGGAWLALAAGLFSVWERRGRLLSDARPWRGRTSRVALCVVLALAVAGAVFLAARGDPLL